MGQALPPVLAVTREDSNHLLLQKQVGGLGPWCPKTVGPPFLLSGSFQKLHIPILCENSEKTMYDTAQLKIIFKLGVPGGYDWYLLHPSDSC